MNLQEAYSILELSSDVSPEDAKKKYKEFAKKYHPDINKEENANDRFKKINEAYQCIINGKGNDRETAPSSHNPFENFDPFNPFGHRHTIQAEHISLDTTISFQESVLGCKKELKFLRKGKCQECAGQGQKHINNGCDKCGGQGQIVGKQGNMIFTRTCDKCWGKNQTLPCNACGTSGTIDTQISINVTIPGGVFNNNILRLSAMGNYLGSVMNMDQYTDAHLCIKVIPEEGLSIIGTDVVSNITISLLEALQGTNKTIQTIFGSKKIDIPPLSRNKEEIILPNLGVNGLGSHKIMLDVQYPINISNIIEILIEKENNKEI